jgi:hypothetical protein
MPNCFSPTNSGTHTSQQFDAWCLRQDQLGPYGRSERRAGTRPILFEHRVVSSSLGAHVGQRPPRVDKSRWMNRMGWSLR